MYSLSGITVSEGVSEGRAFLIIPRTLEDVPEVGQGLNPGEEIAKYRRVSREFASKLNNAMSGTVPDKVRDLFGAVAAYITNADNTRAIELQIACPRLGVCGILPSCSCINGWKGRAQLQGWALILRLPGGTLRAGHKLLRKLLRLARPRASAQPVTLMPPAKRREPYASCR